MPSYTKIKSIYSMVGMCLLYFCLVVMLLSIQADATSHSLARISSSMHSSPRIHEPNLNIAQLNLMSLKSPNKESTFYLAGKFTWNLDDIATYKESTVALSIDYTMVFPYPAIVAFAFFDPKTDTVVASAMAPLPRQSTMTDYVTFRWDRSPSPDNLTFYIRATIDFGDFSIPPTPHDYLVSRFQFTYRYGTTQAVSPSTNLLVFPSLSDNVSIIANCSSKMPELCTQMSYNIIINNIAYNLTSLRWVSVGSSQLPTDTELELSCYVNNQYVDGTIDLTKQTHAIMHVITYNFVQGMDYTIECKNSVFSTSPLIQFTRNQTKVEVTGKYAAYNINKSYTSINPLLIQYDSYHPITMAYSPQITKDVKKWYFVTFTMDMDDKDSYSPSNISLLFHIRGVPVASTDVYVNYVGSTRKPVLIAANVQPTTDGTLPPITYNSIIHRSVGHSITLRVQCSQPSGFIPTSIIQYSMNISYNNIDGTRMERYVKLDTPVGVSLALEPYRYFPDRPSSPSQPLSIPLRPHPRFFRPTVSLIFPDTYIQLDSPVKTQIQCYFGSMALSPAVLTQDKYGKQEALVWNMEMSEVPANTQEFHCDTDISWIYPYTSQIVLEVLWVENDVDMRYIADVTYHHDPL